MSCTAGWGRGGLWDRRWEEGQAFSLLPDSSCALRDTSFLALEGAEKISEPQHLPSSPGWQSPGLKGHTSCPDPVM